MTAPKRQRQLNQGLGTSVTLPSPGYESVLKLGGSVRYLMLCEFMAGDYLCEHGIVNLT